MASLMRFCRSAGLLNRPTFGCAFTPASAGTAHRLLRASAGICRTLISRLPVFGHLLQISISSALPPNPRRRTCTVRRKVSKTNILGNPSVGTIFFVPGVDEVLRINGDAELRDDAELRERFEVRGKLPASVILVKTKEIYLHCAKAILRAGLWDASVQIDRKSLPTIGQMIVDQVGGDRPTQSHEDVKREYEKVLY